MISPLAGKTSSFIKNTQDFVDSIKNPCLLPVEVMVTFDIKSLFTSVPVQEALEVIQGKLMADEALGERTALSADQFTQVLDLYLRNTYFLYKG